MILDDLDLEPTREALIHMENALKSLTQDILPKSPVEFALMAEPVVEYIPNLRREIEDYIGYTFAVAQQAEPAIARMLEGTDFEPSPAEASDAGSAEAAQTVG